MHASLLKNAKITRVANASAAAQTAVAGTILDMQGFDSVLFIASLGDVSDTCVLTLAAQQNTANSATGMAALAGTATFTADATSADNKLLALDVRYPRERYVRAYLTRTTANAVVDSITAIQYNAKDLPVTQSSTVLVSALISDAAES